MVFSNEYPDSTVSSKDRWLIFDINSKLEMEDVTVSQLMKKKKKKKKKADPTTQVWEEIHESNYNDDFDI